MHCTIHDIMLVIVELEAAVASVHDSTDYSSRSPARWLIIMTID